MYGLGETVVVLLAGLASSERFWGEKYDVIGQRARVVAIDPIGFGASIHHPALQETVDAGVHVDAVLEVLRTLDLHTQPVVFVGHSMGASLALRAGARHAPTRAVVAFDAPLYRSAEEANDRIRHIWAGSRRCSRKARWPRECATGCVTTAPWHAALRSPSAPDCPSRSPATQSNTPGRATSQASTHSCATLGGLMHLSTWLPGTSQCEWSTATRTRSPFPGAPTSLPSGLRTFRPHADQAVIVYRSATR
ncbi:alpha/beta fold hydrolase [Microcella sp.]|uniref:alpha/beta fold hydrolase n=1 Tax=Microcella sp. TaxID=1913979 RepID=UPI003F723EC9